MFIRKIKKKSGTYLAQVESYRENGKTKQRVIKYLGKDIEGKAVKTIRADNVRVKKVKRCCDVLAVDKLSKDLTLHELLGKHHKNILLLVYSHLLDRVSINRIEEWAENTEIPNILSMERISSKELYEALTFLNEKDFSKIEEEILKRFMDIEKEKRTIVLDVTDTYFEGKKASCKPRRGKDEKLKKLLQIGLAVTMENGFPLMHKTYEGNISNIMIFKDMSHELRLKGFKTLIIDRGMYSKENLEDALELGLELIAGVKKTDDFIKRFVSKINREKVYSMENRVKLKNTKVYIKSFKYMGGKIIVVYNPSLEVIKRELHYEKGGNDIGAKYLGYTLLFHNTILSDKNAVKKYFEKDLIERSFKQMKGALALRPIRLWLKEHVEAHAKICYLAYAILSLFSYRTKDLDISAAEAMEKLKTCYRVYLEDKKSDFAWNSLVTLEKIQRDTLDSIGVVYKN